jgi:hypothetical protein
MANLSDCIKAGKESGEAFAPYGRWIGGGIGVVSGAVLGVVAVPVGAVSGGFAGLGGGVYTAYKYMDSMSAELKVVTVVASTVAGVAVGAAMPPVGTAAAGSLVGAGVGHMGAYKVGRMLGTMKCLLAEGWDWGQEETGQLQSPKTPAQPSSAPKAAVAAAIGKPASAPAPAR